MTEHDDWNEALLAVLDDVFDLTEQDLLLRACWWPSSAARHHRTLPREEAARSHARTLMRDLEFAWGIFLARGMQQGLIPESDPRLLTRALLGLHNSIWHWYHPGGTLDLRRWRVFIEWFRPSRARSPDHAARMASPRSVPR